MALDLKQLQFHEYLALLEGSIKSATPDPALAETWLEQAKKLWPQLGIAKWAKHPRQVEYVARTPAGVQFVHVTADWTNCFLILVVPAGAVQADAWILFDIGAQYNEPMLICPAFDLEEAATPEQVRTIIPQLGGEDDPFAILEIGDGTYLQTYAEGDLYEVEHQLVSTKQHFKLPEPVEAAVVVDLFLSYAFGKYEWSRERVWEPMELD